MKTNQPKPSAPTEPEPSPASSAIAKAVADGLTLAQSDDLAVSLSGAGRSAADIRAEIILAIEARDAKPIPEK